MLKTTKIDWLNHFLEFIVVILGILIAFQLNTCAIEKKQDIMLDRHMSNILEETNYNRRNVKNSLEASENLLKNIDSLFVQIETGKDLQKMNSLAFEILSVNNTYYKQNAYNSLIQSGDVRFFSDFETKDDIIQLYEYYTWAQAIETVTIDSYKNYYYPYVIDNLDLTDGRTQEFSVYSNLRFKNIITAYRYMMVFNIQKQKDVLLKIDTFLESTNP